jgi:hypothetical protein
VLAEVFPVLGGVFAKDACIIHFDLNSYEIAKKFPDTLGALADPRAACPRARWHNERGAVRRRASAPRCAETEGRATTAGGRQKVGNFEMIVPLSHYRRDNNTPRIPWHKGLPDVPVKLSSTKFQGTGHLSGFAFFQSNSDQ